MQIYRRYYFKKLNTFRIIKRFTKLIESQQKWFIKQHIINKKPKKPFKKTYYKSFLSLKSKKTFTSKAFRFFKFNFFRLEAKKTNLAKLVTCKIKDIYFLKNLSFFIYRRFETLRNLVYLNKFHKVKHFKIWKNKNFSIFYIRALISFFKFLKNKNDNSSSICYFTYLRCFYNKFSAHVFLNDFIRYAYLKQKLKDHGKIFTSDLKKKLIKVAPSDITFSLLSFSSKFRNFITRKGFGEKALKMWIQVLLMLKFRYNRNFLEKFLNVLEIIRPQIAFRNMHIGGRGYRIPVLITTSKSYLIAMRWLKKIASGQSGILHKNLFNLIEASLKLNGAVIKYKNDYHNLAIENKSYIRFLRFYKT